MWTLTPDHHVVLAAFLLDAVLGDPPWLYRKIPHPVTLLGTCIAGIERRLNAGPSALRRRAAGLLTVLAVVGLAVAAALLLRRYVVQVLSHGWLIEALVASTLIAYRGLYDHVLAVAGGLEHGLARGREAVGHVVGRDPESLDRAGVARAAVESLAENFSDGVVAPLFWYLLAGLPGLFAYKAINTLDSMIGQRSARYLYFGQAAARLDDAVNYVPARLAGLVFVAAASLLPRARGLAAFTTMWRCASRHRSPNAGWQEAAVAGALGFALAGPRRYAHEVVDDAWMGAGRADLDAADVRASLHLYLAAGAVVAGLLAALWLLE